MPAMRDHSTTRQRPTARSSRAECRTTVRRVQAAQDRAAWRFALARIVRDLAPLGPTETVCRLTTIVIAGTHTMQDGTTLTLPRCPDLEGDETLTNANVATRATPSEGWVRAMRRRTEDRMTISHFVDRPRSGRPPVELSPALQQVMREQVMRPGSATEAVVLLAVQAQAVAQGDPAPTRRRVRRAFHAIPLADLTAARHGKRAVIADALPKGALPYTRPGDCSLLDETQLPLYYRVWDPITRTYLAVKAWACLVVDAASEVIIGKYIPDAMAKGKLGAVDGTEIFAAFVSSICPAVASAACAPYVGTLPAVLRCDNVRSHGLVSERAAKIGIDVSHNPIYQPWANGALETTNGIIKPLCRDIVGYDQHWAVAEYENDDQYKRRRRLAATITRLPPHIYVTIEQLPDIVQLREQFDEVVKTYNRTLIHSRWKHSRDTAFHTLMRRESRQPWTNALPMLECTTVHVRDKLTVQGASFATTSDTGEALLPGARGTFAVDPMLRALWRLDADATAPVASFMPDKLWAQQQVPGDVVARNNAVASAASDNATEARLLYQADRLGGPAEAALANAVGAQQRNERPGAKRKSTAPRKKTSGARSRPAAAQTVRGRPLDQITLEFGSTPVPNEAPHRAEGPMPVATPPRAAAHAIPISPRVTTPADTVPLAPKPPVLTLIPGGATPLPPGLARRSLAAMAMDLAARALSDTTVPLTRDSETA